MFVSVRPLKSKKNLPFAIVVSSKTYKRAVDRNKLKRRMRAIVKNSKNLPNRPITFFLQKGTLDLSFAELKKEVEQSLIKYN